MQPELHNNQDLPLAMAVDDPPLFAAEGDDPPFVVEGGEPPHFAAGGNDPPFVAEGENPPLVAVEGGAPPIAAEGRDILANIRDGVVAERMLMGYINDNLSFLNWSLNSGGNFDCLTVYGKDQLAAIQILRNGEQSRAFNARVRSEFKALLRNAHEEPIVNLDRITPDGYMEYLVSLHHLGRGGYLSKSSYGSKRAALYHLFRAHNRTGMPPEFCNQLAVLYRGFYRRLAQHRPIRAAINNHEAVHSGEGKAAMSIALYKAICGWFLDYGTSDGLFAHCFLTLTWNLACRSNNTSLIKFKDIVWSSCFDSFQVYFQHSKTDQLGDEAKYPRHIYANPVSPSVCPILSLTLYLSACFNCPVAEDSKLFPGKEQEDRFSKMLNRVLAAHEAEVLALGYPLNFIGTHSIRKGAVSYLSSVPGGPPAAAVCVRAGWTMGRVRDIYMRYVDSGDQFVGRCLALLPLLSSQFACSPPYFSRTATDDENRLMDTLRVAQFPMLANIPNYRMLTRMCLALLLFHRQWIYEKFMVNHVIHVCSIALRQDTVSRALNDNPQLVVVTYPWNDEVNVYSGVPPYVSMLQELTVLRTEQ